MRSPLWLSVFAVAVVLASACAPGSTRQEPISSDNAARAEKHFALAIEGEPGNLVSVIDPADQRNLYRDLVRIYAQDLPVLPLYFKIDSAIFRDGVVGPNTSAPGPSLAWNIADWDITRST